jgi:hypothetical protein
MPGGTIQKLYLSFETNNRYSKDSLRWLLINSARTLLSEINNNAEIQQFLIKTPFDMDGIQIIIFNHDANGRGLIDPEISSGQISNNIPTYATIDPENILRYKISAGFIGFA